MDTYVRKIKGILKGLRFGRRAHAPWLRTFLAGLGFGVVAGTAATALLTPTNGKETRQLVRSKAKQMANRANKQIATVSTGANGAKEELHV